MDILVIAQNLDNTAPGSVFKNIIKGISIYNNVDLLYDGDFEEKQLKRVRTFIPCQSNKLLDYVGRRYINYRKINPWVDSWSKKAINTVNGKKYDVVCVMLTSSYYYPLWCGKAIADKCNAKYAVYCVDAIPAPGWGESNFSKFQSMLISRELKHCDYFATINEKMLEYQLTTFENKPGLKYGVIYMPIDEHIASIGKPNNKHVFLYTGGVYGKRKIDYIIRAFARVCDTYKDAKLVFVGSHMKRSFVEQIAGDASQSIDLVRYTKDLTPFYNDSAVFLSVDADIPNDVFLASKLMKYLPYDRQILCETGEGSPTHMLLDGLNTVIICDHDEDDLYKGMLKAIENVDTADYTERYSLLKELSIETQGRKLTEAFESII